jgi:hypothetical protein
VAHEIKELRERGEAAQVLNDNEAYRKKITQLNRRIQQVVG